MSSNNSSNSSLKSLKSSSDSSKKVTRIAIVNEDKCKPEKCNLECKKSCPVNRIGKKCIDIDKFSKIEENLCIGCGICIKKCPYNAIDIISIPTNLDKDTSYRYGVNSFKLHRLPIPKPGRVLGLVGTNGIGKSTALKILGGKIRPNFGNSTTIVTWSDVAKFYKGSELHGYFTRFLEGDLITANKIQYVDKIPKILFKMFDRSKSKKLSVNEVLIAMDERKMKDYYIKKFELKNVLNRNLDLLSGGELQRFSIAVNCMKNADVYVFDEPTSYLDVKQRLTAAREIRKLADNTDKYVIIVEHDLAILDLVSDYGCVFYGQPGVYGVISSPFSIKSAINIFLDGFIPTENMRFRKVGLKFNIQQLDDDFTNEKTQFKYSGCVKTFNDVHCGNKINGFPKLDDKDDKKFDNKKLTNDLLTKDLTNLNLNKKDSKHSKNTFKLEIQPGFFSNNEITVFLGENGMGKSTFVNLLAGIIKDDSGELLCEGKTVSIKPQKIIPKFKGTVRTLFSVKLRGRMLDSTFQNEVIKPLNIDYLMDSEISSLSGGELQRISIILCLGKDADIYLFDEPAAFLDSDQRIAICKIIKKYIYSNSKSAFVVEHDLIVATYLADRIVVFEGEPGISAVALSPMDVKDGMNKFLKILDVTFRRDSTNFRPRINKPDSSKDREQKANNNYFFTNK